MSIRNTIATAVAVAFLAAGSAQAATIVNGGFEAGTGDGPPYTTLNGGSTAITGWTVTGGSIDWINGYWQASEGTHSLDLNGLSVGGVQQTFATTAGQKYQVSFDMSGNPDQGSATRSILVSAGADSQTFNYSFTVGPNGHSNMNWQSNLFQFTATGASTTLKFDSTSTGNCCWGPALDNVSISDVAGVPEPATWAMTILGMGMIGASLRRRQLAFAKAR